MDIHEPIDFLKLSLQRYPLLYDALRAARRHIVEPQIEVARRETIRRIQAIEEQVQAREAKDIGDSRPVVFLIASSHITHFGLGAAIGLLSSWALRLTGQRVVYYVCKEGLSQCVLGSNRQGVVSRPPCDACISLRNSIYPLRHTVELNRESQKLHSLRSELNALTWPELTDYCKLGWNLGKLCLPSLRWVERRFNLDPNEFRQHMLIEYIVSAANLAEEFARIIDQLQPLAVVLFNGTHYPEATARKVAVDRGVRVFTYEVGFRSTSAFFSDGVATEYPIHIPPCFTMGITENKKLDEYLFRRFQGDFTQAGVKFWSEMQPLPVELCEKAKAYRQVVTVFTNVTWDTSQVYAHAFFNSMFEWLDCTLREAAEHPDTLFIVRAHPHDSRLEKPSKEPVADWLSANGYLSLPNLMFIPPDSEVSSYELMSLSKFCVVYNSTVGLEAAALGKFVLPGGWTRYRQAGACYDITSKEEYCVKLRELLECEQPVSVPTEWLSNARRYFYFSLFNASLDISSYLKPIAPPDFTLKHFDLSTLTVERSPEMRVIVEGILNGGEFYYS